MTTIRRNFNFPVSLSLLFLMKERQNNPLIKLLTLKITQDLGRICQFQSTQRAESTRPDRAFARASGAGLKHAKKSLNIVGMEFVMRSSVNTQGVA